MPYARLLLDTDFGAVPPTPPAFLDLARTVIGEMVEKVAGRDSVAIAERAAARLMLRLDRLPIVLGEQRFVVVAATPHRAAIVEVFGELTAIAAPDPDIDPDDRSWLLAHAIEAGSEAVMARCIGSLVGMGGAVAVGERFTRYRTMGLMPGLLVLAGTSASTSVSVVTWIGLPVLMLKEVAA